MVIAMLTSVVGVTVLSGSAEANAQAVLRRDGQVNGRPGTWQSQYGGGVPLATATADALRRLDTSAAALGVTTFAILSIEASITNNEATTPCTVSGLVGNPAQIRALDHVRGTPIMTVGAMEAPAAGFVANLPAAANFDAGSKVRVAGSVVDPPLTGSVGGVLDDGLLTCVLYTSASTLIHFMSGGVGPDHDVVVYYHSADERAALHYRVLLKQMLGRAGFEEAGFNRVDQSELLRRDVANVRRVAMIVYVLAALLCSVGIFGVGVAAVRERVPELSMRRAFGASRTQLFVVIITESLGLGVVATLLAVPTSLALLPVTVQVFGITTAMTAATIAGSLTLGISVALAACLLGGLWPAVVASRVSIGNVMRE